MVDDFQDARTAALAGLFDNAAIFPPANQTLADAVASHRGHLEGERGWLVRRLLVRASDVAQLSDLLEPTDEVELGVVLDGAGGQDFAQAVAADVDSLSVFARDRRIRLTAVEVTMQGQDPEGEMSALLSALGARLDGEVGVAVEVPVAGRPAGYVLRGLGAIATRRAGGGSNGSRVTAKVRCGGAVAGAVPADVELAGFLRACARQEVPFKATAGLHHPTRTENPDHGALEHGFLNLLAASASAFGGDRLDVIQAHLARPAGELKLGPGAMIVGGEVLEGTVLATTRKDFFTSIGCCDILDPITDLAQMGVVQPTGGLA